MSRMRPRNPHFEDDYTKRTSLRLLNTLELSSNRLVAANFNTSDSVSR